MESGPTEIFLEKNTLKGKSQVLFEQNDQSLIISENLEDLATQQTNLIRKSIIHFYFCVEGSAVFDFGPHYSREIQRQHNYFFFNPEKDLTFTL